MDIPLKRGPVWVTSRRERGILLGPGRPGTYKVLLASDVMDVPATDLSPFDTPPPPLVSMTLALHDLKEKDAVEMVDRKIQRAVLSNADRIKIIHGDTKGKIRKAIHEYLASSRLVKNFEDDQSRPDVTWVYFHGSQREQ